MKRPFKGHFYQRRLNRPGPMMPNSIPETIF